MPRYREIYIKKEAKIIIWKIEETEDELISFLDTTDLSPKFHSYKSLSHRKQFLATQILLKREEIQNKIIKDVNGKPCLKSGFVSISHDTNYVSLMISNKVCGIDLQSVSPKVLRIKHKFYDEDDLEQFGEEIDFYTLMWSLKEALYKLFGVPKLFFKEHLRINYIQDNIANCSILHPEYVGEYNVYIGKVDNLYLVYTI